MELTFHSLHANILDSSKVYCAKALHIFEDVYSGTKQEDLISCPQLFLNVRIREETTAFYLKFKHVAHVYHTAGRVYDT